MNFSEAQKYLWGGTKLTRKNWSASFYVEAEHQDQTRRLKLVDSCGRDYGISTEDQLADDWIIYED